MRLIRANERRSKVQDQNEGPLITPAEPFQRSFKSWFYWRFWRNPLLEVPENHPQDDQRKAELPLYLKVTTWLLVDLAAHWKAISIRGLFLRAYLTAFEFDGFDVTRGTVTCADYAKPIPFDQSHLSWQLLLSAFLGLPNRPAAVKEGNKIVPKLTGKQLWKNFIGGWFQLYHYEGEEDAKTAHIKWDAWWQIITLPFKIFLIFPLKLLVIAAKLFINTIKLFTEILLPIVVLPLIRFLVGIALKLPLTICEKAVSWLAAPFLFAWNAGSRGALIALSILGFPFLLVDSAIRLVAFTLNAISRLIVIVARAISSPEKSARMAFAYGRELRGEILGVKVGNIVGVVGAALSLAITAVAWAFLFPLLIGTVVFVTGLANVPFVASSLSVLQGAVLTVGTALGAAFGPAITFVATALTLQVSSVAITVGTAVGLISGIVLPMASRIADEMSNWWARQEGGRFNAHRNGEELKRLVHEEGGSPLSSFDKGAETSKPGAQALDLVSGKVKAGEGAHKRSAGATSAEDAALLPGAHPGTITMAYLPLVGSVAAESDPWDESAVYDV